MNVIKRTYLVEIPFPGHTESIVNYFEDGSNTVAYSGYLYNSNVRDLTLEEYRKARPELKDLKEVSDEEMTEMYAVYEQSLVTEPAEVSEERYWEMLEVLPPCRWSKYGGCSSFHISERYTGDLVSWFAQCQGKWYEWMDFSTISGRIIDAKVLSARYPNE